MNTLALVEVIASATAVIVAALSYFLTKMKEREADWRKWKYEQYKAFLAALSGNAGPPSFPRASGFTLRIVQKLARASLAVSSKTSSGKACRAGRA